MSVNNLDLSVRFRTPEIMDQPDLDSKLHVEALRGLGRINVLSRSDAIVWPAIARLAREQSPRPIRVLDLACGGGDVALQLSQRAARARLNIQVEGCDISPLAVEFAAQSAKKRNADARFFVFDALGDPLPEVYDVVMCSLFLHHLDEDEAVALLRRMATAARRLVLVNDLVRGRLGYLMAWLGCRVLSRSKVVHFDGPASVRGAFTIDEAKLLAERASLERATLTKHWPQRFLLTWSRE